jgi:hypothetical protein
MKNIDSPSGASNSDLTGNAKLAQATATVVSALAPTAPVPAAPASPGNVVTTEIITPVAVVTAAEANALLLTPPQRAAIIQLTSGATRSAAALAAGVTRTTLYKWLNHDPAFQAAYNAWHKDLITTAQSQLLAASHEAIACVLTAIRRGDARLAWKLLESQGLTKTPKPGSTDVAHLQRQAELELKRAEIAQRKEINDVWMDDMTTIDAPSSPL